MFCGTDFLGGGKPIVSVAAIEPPMANEVATHASRIAPGTGMLSDLPIRMITNNHPVGQSKLPTSPPKAPLTNERSTDEVLLRE